MVDTYPMLKAHAKLTIYKSGKDNSDFNSST